jgi:hypothetical protein
MNGWVSQLVSLLMQWALCDVWPLFEDLMELQDWQSKDNSQEDWMRMRRWYSEVLTQTHPCHHHDHAHVDCHQQTRHIQVGAVASCCV